MEKDKKVCFRLDKNKKRSLMLYVYDNDTSIQELFEDYVDQLLTNELEDEQIKKP